MFVSKSACQAFKMEFAGPPRLHRIAILDGCGRKGANNELLRPTTPAISASACTPVVPGPPSVVAAVDARHRSKLRAAAPREVAAHAQRRSNPLDAGLGPTGPVSLRDPVDIEPSHQDLSRPLERRASSAASTRVGLPTGAVTEVP